MARRVISGGGVGRLAFQPLFQMNLSVTFLFVASRELAAALIATERLLAGVRSHVSG